MDADPALESTGNPDVEMHLRDYSHFTHLLKWGAIVAFVVAILVLLIIG